MPITRSRARVVVGGEARQSTIYTSYQDILRMVERGSLDERRCRWEKRVREEQRTEFPTFEFWSHVIEISGGDDYDEDN